MARIYSRKKGKSGSKKPVIKRLPKWSRYKKNEVEELVVKLAKKRHSSASIGTVLRDRYGIPDVKLITGKSISEIMKANKYYPELPEELMNLLKRSVNLRDHLEKNRSDKHSKKGLENMESKIRRLGKYYIRKGVLPKGWKYDPKQAKLIIQK